MENILVTGAAGFIGSKTSKLLLESGLKVVGVDSMNDYYDVRLKSMRVEELCDYDNFTFYNENIENLSVLDNIFRVESIDAVINLAARAGVRYSIDNPHVYITTNINGSVNLLELCKKYEISKYVLASSSSVYANQQMPFVETLPVNEPISPYAASKKSAENFAYTYHYLYGIDVSILRFFTVFGPAGRPDMSYFKFIKNILEKKSIEIYGDGSQGRDFTFVDDIARGVVASLKKVGCEIFNLGGGNNPYTVNYMIELIEKAMNKKANIDYKPFAKEDMKFTWADISKASSVLDWSPKVSFEEGIIETVSWALDNKAFIKSLI
jgi:nucleoside-diphosphate-sugar epimerase